MYEKEEIILEAIDRYPLCSPSELAQRIGRSLYMFRKICKILVEKKKVKIIYYGSDQTYVKIKSEEEEATWIKRKQKKDV